MEFSDDITGQGDALAALFTASFTVAEGAEEGAMIGALLRDVLARTPPGDVRVFTARPRAGPVVGAAVFTRLVCGDDPRRVMLLSPMAVAPDRQGQGIGQALLRHALAALRADAVAVAVTYGDPGFYGRVGFVPVPVATVPAPRPLRQPEGWLAQSLSGGALIPLPGPCRCAAALDDPAFW